MEHEMTPQARDVLERYLDRVRSGLAGSSLDSAEVVSDIRDHVAAAMALGGQPVEAEEITRILADLGTPEQWILEHSTVPSVSPADLPTPAGTLRPMAILVFALTVAGLAAFPWVGPLGLLVAWIGARVFLVQEQGNARSLGPNRWLVLPALVLFAAGCLAVVVVAPIGPLVEAPLELPRWMIVGGGLLLWYGLLAFLGFFFRSFWRGLLFPRLSLSRGDTR
jgi:hypothetical protein